jgi:hypothetical protein
LTQFGRRNPNDCGGQLLEHSLLQHFLLCLSGTVFFGKELQTGKKARAEAGGRQGKVRRKKKLFGSGEKFLSGGNACQPGGGNVVEIGQSKQAVWRGSADIAALIALQRHFVEGSLASSFLYGDFTPESGLAQPAGIKRNQSWILCFIFFFLHFKNLISPFSGFIDSFKHLKMIVSVKSEKVNS